MKPNVPSVVVIHERHVRYGENYKIFRVTNRSKREYISKFMSSRKMILRSKSRQVIIGRKTKELRYKGSPLAISRLLLLDGLADPFPRMATEISETGGLVRREADSASASVSSETTNAPLSFFNLADARSSGGDSGRLDHARLASLEALIRASRNCGMDKPLEIACCPRNLPDYHLLFGSDTNDNDDFDSGDEDEALTIEYGEDSVAPQKDPENANKKQQKAMKESIKKIEKDVKQIAGSIQSAFEAAQKVAVPVAPLEREPIPNQQQEATPHNSVASVLAEPNTPPIMQAGVQNIGNIRCNLAMPGANDIPNPAMFSSCGCIQNGGNVPFFRVPGGCIMVIRATNQTTPVLHGTFITGNSYQFQYQQVQLPIHSPLQNITIHLGPQRLRTEEVQRIFGTVKYANIFRNPSNLGHM